jgi:betaine-aldehyde dehydrogenase
MTTTVASEPTSYRWSSTDGADRFAVEDPATGDVIALLHGGGTAEVNADTVFLGQSARPEGDGVQMGEKGTAS